MKRSIPFVLLAVLVACHRGHPGEPSTPVAVLAVRPQPAVEEQTIRGIVVSADHRTRVPQASVELVDVGLRVLAEADGRFVLGPVSAGRHELRVRTIGYVTLEQTLEMPAGVGAAVVVNLAPRTLCLDYCAPRSQPRSTVDNAQ